MYVVQGERDLVEKFRQHGRIPNVATGDFNSPNLQRLLVEPPLGERSFACRATDVDLAPIDPRFRHRSERPWRRAFLATVFAGVPFAFTLDLDACAVDQQVQRPLRAAKMDVDGKGLLTAARGAEIRHIPVQTDERQQALHEARGLPQRHSKQHLHRQAGLDGKITVDGLAAPLAGRLRRAQPGRIKPNRQRPPVLERLVIRGPVQGLISRCVRSARPSQLPRWIHTMNPSQHLCNKAALSENRQQSEYIFPG